ncbi:MAG: FtsX-like permease family protein [Ruminococcus sp.]|nr:FtsX-like permease family protein [Ruminococcus sp.]
MRILNKLTLKHLKMNKKRTLVTIIGIILSTALMVGLGLLISSFMSSMLESAKESYGAYQAYFEAISNDDLNVLSKNVNIDKLYYYKPIGFARVETDIKSKPYLYVVEGNDVLLSTLSLESGVMPKNSNEIVVSKSLIDFNSGYKLGDTLTLDIGTRYYEEEDYEHPISDNSPVPVSWLGNEEIYQKEEIIVKENRTYKIVGIVSDSHYEDYNSAGIMAFSLNTQKGDIYNTYVEYKDPRKTYQYTKEIISNLNIQKSDVNEALLYYYGATKYSNINNTLIPLMIIALTVISVGCIIVIYNSFAISTMERKKSFGLYASIGATMKQIKHTVLFEALIVGVIGIVLGVLGGFLGIYILIKVLNYLLAGAFTTIIFKVEPLYIIIPLIFMVIVIIVSAYIPAKRSSKVAPIEAIRGNDDIKVGKKDIKTPKFITKIFGVEGAIAFKNIKRNKKKYRITIISLFISIVMFNTFTTFLGYFTKASDTAISYDYDIAIDLRGKEEDIKKDVKSITSKYKYENLMVRLYTMDVDLNNLDENDLNSYYKNRYSIEDLTFLTIVLEDSFYNKLTQEEALLINKKYFAEIDQNTRKFTEIKVFTKDRYNLNVSYNEKNINLNAKVTNEDIYGFRNYKTTFRPVMIISETTYKNKFITDDVLEARIMLSSKEYKTIYDDLENDKVNFNTSNNSYFSPAMDEISERNIIIAVNILFYGFIALITLIGVTSVINTINTNMNLRRKEFAMLRSIGLTPKGFNKLLFFESLFFGLKALIYGIPVSILINILISLIINNVIDTSLIIPWNSLIISVIAVFIIVLITMNYAAKKIKKENILEALREENI